MKFGKTLLEKVSDEWKVYVVDYKGMKKILGASFQEDPTALNKSLFLSPWTTTRRVTSEDNYDERDTGYESFWSLYEKSKFTLKNFYREKELWAMRQLLSLRQRFDEIRSMPMDENSSTKYHITHGPSYYKDSQSSLVHSSTPVTDGPRQSYESLKQDVVTFELELALIKEFLELNSTAFSKILKKYDKRTASHVRETKMEELRKTDPYLDAQIIMDLQEKALNLKMKMGAAERLYQRQIVQSTSTSSGSSSDHYRSFIFKTRQILQHAEKESPFFATNSQKRLPHFTSEEVKAGDILGKGEFGVVKEIREFHVCESCHICFLHRAELCYCAAGVETSEISSDSITTSAALTTGKEEHSNEMSSVAPIDDGEFVISFCDHLVDLDMDEVVKDHLDDSDEVANRGFMKDHCLRGNNKQSRYAMKSLRDDLNYEQQVDGIIDLALEAKFLAALCHPNIVKMRGTGGIPGHPKFFIVLDRLYDTLAERCKKWSSELKKSLCCWGLRKNRKRFNLLWRERLLAAFDIARALRYLHSQSIIYRDMKPENVGFDVRGDVKVFDFGLCKELLRRDKIGEDQYRASGLTGTRRYMAPEIALCKPYGLSADVFSFAILLWEILSLRVPFENYTYEKHSRLVVRRGDRPQIPYRWPISLRDLISEGWSSNPSHRPNFVRICNLIKGEILQFQDEDATLELAERTVRMTNNSIASRNGIMDIFIATS